MDRQRGTSLLVLPVVLAFIGCGTDAGGKSDGAPESTGAASEGTLSGDKGNTGTSDDSGGAGTGSGAGSTSTSGGVTAAPDDGSTGGGDTSGASKGDSGDSDDSTGGGESTGKPEESTGGVAGPSFVQTVWPIFDEECGCHQDSNGAGKLRLAEEDAYANLVGKPSQQLPSMQLVEPGDPDKSYLWHKLNNTHKDAGGKGKKMPPGGLLDADKLAVVEQWIVGGAEP